jgi:DMSO/TMAO reductase YedYZ molybdopterin-dependent catalytic subunit
MRRRLYGVARGLVATLAGLATGELVAGLFREAASPVVPVGQVVIDRVPAGLREWAIETFGTADKAVLVLGTIFALAVIGSLVGLLAEEGWWSRRPAFTSAAYGVTAAVGLAGVLAVLERPDPTFPKMLPALAGTVVSLAALWWLGSAARSAALDARPAEGYTADRREFVLRASSLGLGALMIGGLGRVLRRRFDVDGERASFELPPVGPNADSGEPPVDSVPVGPPTTVAEATDTSEFEFGLDGVESFLVPNSDFYRIDTALVVPQVRQADWTLRIHGMVDRELELTFGDLVERPTVERMVTLSCVSNQVGGNLVGNALWQGVLLAPLLEECGVHPEATQVVSRSVDGWDCGSPTSVIMDGRDAMLAYGMNREPLPAEHGYPVRLVVPGLYGYVSATKWVTEIELTRWEDYDAYWVPRGWSKEGPVKTMARIDRPRDGRELAVDAGGAVTFGGVAWAVHRGIGRVEVSIDDGEWQACELAGVPSDDTWRQWRLIWPDAPAGEHRITARAYDAAGEPQPEGPANPAPDGAEGYHSVRFDVTPT